MLLKVKQWLRANLTTPAPEIMKQLAVKLNGYYRYYGITDNSISISNFGDEVRKLLYKMLNRRSQSRSMNWNKYVLFLKKYPLPRPKIYVNIFDLKPELS